MFQACSGRWVPVLALEGAAKEAVARAAQWSFF